MNFLLLSSLAAAVAAALVDHSNCRQHSSQKPSVSSSVEVQCFSEVEASGVVLLSKRSALSKAVFKHEVADIEVGDKATHTLGGVANRFSAAIGALPSTARGLFFMTAKPKAGTVTIAKSSTGALWFLLLLACGLVLAVLVFQLRNSQRKHDIYDDDNDTQEGWKHESWVRGHHRHRDATDDVDRTKFLAAQLARGERPTYSTDGGTAYQDAWMQEAKESTIGSTASSSSQPQQKAYVERRVEKSNEHIERFVEKRGEAVLAEAARAGDAARGLGKELKGARQKVAKRFDKATGKSLTKLTQAVDETGTRLAKRWDEARAGNIR